MALTRYTQKIFAQNATTGLGQFGSGIANTKVTSTNVETLQALTAYLNGWSSAIITNKNYPTWQERNGIDYGFSYQLAYIFENGIPEYDDGTTYKIGSIVKKTGTFELYGSIVNNNTGNLLSDTTKWKFLLNLSTTPFVKTTYTDGTSGYIIYSDGYCEQWGLYYGTIGATQTHPISLLKTYRDTNYNISVTCYSGEFITGAYQTGTNSFVHVSRYYDDDLGGTTSTQGVYWRTVGYLASGQY